MKSNLSKICAVSALALLAMAGTNAPAHAETLPIGQSPNIVNAAPSIGTFNREIAYMNRQMENFFNSFPDTNMGMNGSRRTDWRMSSTVPATDIIDNGKDFIVRVALPGRNPKNIHISITKNYITLKGRKTVQKTVKSKDYLLRENSSGAFARTITLPQSADAARAKATYKEGMLTITVPKKAEAKIKPRTLPIKTID